MTTDTIAAVKFTKGSTDTIEGIGIPFGGPFGGKDIDGDDFGPDTDLCLDWFEKRPLLYEHGQDKKLGHAKIGTVIEHNITDDGLWVKAQLDTRSKYFAVVKKLIDAQALSFSAGALDYLIKGAPHDSKHATRWPWMEMSLTPKPANPAAVMYSVKSADVLAHFEDAEIEVPSPVKVALEALDEWAIEQTHEAPASESYAERSELVLAGLKAWVDDTLNRVEMRQVSGSRKSGRELSKANVEVLRDAHRIIGELLERADAPAKDEERATAAKAAYATFLRIEAESLTG